MIGCVVAAVSLASLNLNLLPVPREVAVGTGFAPADVAVAVAKDATLPAEGYRLEVTTNGIRIVSRDAAGAFYAKKTLGQLKNADGTYPVVTVSDAPAYRWRGLLLDESRAFYGKEFVLKLLDWMADYKFNVFHWHLVDDEGWRVPSDHFPRLNTVGACGQCGYTKEEIAEIRRFAAERSITIVPEMEIPGHSQEVVRAYPEFFCEGADPKDYSKMNCIGLCLGKDATIRFFETALDEFCELFPDSPVIHIGGDECPRENWKKCADCQKRIKDLSLRDEDHLQAWYTQYFVNYLAKKGRKAVGWDEILAGGLAEGVMVMSWQGMSGGRRAAALGREVVMCPTVPCYFNYPQGLGRDEPVVYPTDDWVKQVPLERVYAFDPCFKVPEADRKYVIGSQCCLWGEKTPTAKACEWKLFPRFFAIAEVMWSGSGRPGFADFLPRCEVHRERMVQRGINAAPVK